MKRMIGIYILGVLFTVILSACSNMSQSENITKQEMAEGMNQNDAYTINTKISDVVSNPSFGDYGRLIFPDDSGYYSGNTLGELRLTWYNNIDSNKTVEIVNYMKEHAESRRPSGLRKTR